MTYWEIQNDIAERAAEDRRFVDEALGARRLHRDQAIDYDGTEELEASNFNSVITDEDEGEEERGAENATGQEIRDSILRIVRENSEKAGAGIVDRFLRILMLKNLPAGMELLRSEGLVSVAAITKEVDYEVRESMKERGFRPVWVANPQDNTEGVCVFVRDAVGVIERQLKMASISGPKGRNFYFNPLRFQSRVTGEPERTHPMSGDLANDCFERVKAEVMQSPDMGTYWDTDMSFMCLLQIYSDKSSMSLSTKSHVFYPLHIAVLNLTSELKDSIIRRGETVVAYLSTSSKWNPIPDDAEILHPRPLRAAKKDSSQQFMDTLNPQDNAQINKIIFRCSLAAVLRKLRDVSLPGLRFLDADSTPRRAHMVLAAYSGDTPEIHLVTCTKQTGCARCRVDTTKLCEPGLVGNMRSDAGTMRLLLSAQRASAISNYEPRDKMWSDGYSTTEPALLGWPFMSIPGLGLYEIARFDLLHCGPLGLLKHILKAVWERTKSKTMQTALVLDGSGKPKTFSSISGRVLRACNDYLHDIDKNSPAVGFSVNFRRGKKKAVLDGLFTDDGIASMLQGKDYRMVQEILPFVGVLIDRYCGKGYAAGEEVPKQPPAFPVLTKAFVYYQNMDQAIRRKDMEDVGFTDAGVKQLQKAIRTCLSYVITVLGRYQKSGFNFVKLHAYNHLVDDIRALGLHSGFDTSIFEAGHPVYKAASRATSRRLATATEDAAKILSRNECARVQLTEKMDVSSSARIVNELVNGAPRRGTNIPRSVSEAVQNDVAVFPSNGMSFMWMTLSNIVTRSYYQGEDVAQLLQKHESRVASGMKEYLELVGDLSLAHKSLNVIRMKALHGDSMSSESEDIGNLSEFEKRSLLRSIHVTVLKSARVAGHRAPSLQNLLGNGRIFLSGGRSGHRIVQRLISSASFSHSKKTFQDCVMIDGNPGNESQTDTGQHPASTGEFTHRDDWEVWAAQALAFVRVRASAGPLSCGKGEEYVVVRYFEAIRRIELDSIDRATGCIKLRWARDPCPLEDDKQEPWIDVVPASSMRGRLHIVDEPYIRHAGEPERMWTAKAFYINQYKLSNYEPSYHTDDRINE